LKFQLHSAKFLLLSKDGQLSKAVDYARKEMAPFKDTKKLEIQQLLGGLVLLASNNEKMEKAVNDIFSTLREASDKELFYRLLMIVLEFSDQVLQIPCHRERVSSRCLFACWRIYFPMTSQIF